ncbi:MAG: lamin tail domain-containing protein [Candidatus Edwardsbacteria bacterium]|nr:lamin tail domain-containing protein [Candidatus Edwardsbacteria bacterium]MBU1577125.1 lamin tail domain-containing protein [Candidatus Edwardsbacteria bacterium]MBU2463797.1 lamin tail domain-containing protein [Candidatus Edwardsbacteria bacterium]MBU2593779.1 lamin tail domain-containing protein [Candidatus Edwardsbacteria bacterium]
MKKTVFALILVLAAASVNAQILINEVQYDPTSGGTDSLCEWIELYNPTGDDVDLTGWVLCDNGDSIGETFPSVVIAAGEYIAFVCNVDSFLTYFPSATNYYAWTSGSFGDTRSGSTGYGLGNSADILVMVNSIGTVIDEVNWGTVSTSWPTWIKYGAYGWSPGVSDAPAGHSIGRSPNGFDSDQVTDWADMATPTPGATNGGAVVYTPHTIYEIQNGGALTDSNIITVGIVTSAKWVEFTGFAMADAAGAWHGITVSSNTPVNRGDSVSVSGTVQEYNDRTQISASLVTVLGTGTVPAVTDVQLSDVKTGAANAESFEGVLVRVPKALSTDTTWMSPTFGEWAVCRGIDTLMIDNSSNSNGIYYAKPVFGVDSVTVTGILNYTYSNFKIMPRDSADVINHGPTGVTGQPLPGKAVFSLLPCSPNPASRDARFSFSLANQSKVDLSVFNVLGQKVATVYSGQMSAGQHSISWNLKGQRGEALPNGVYFYNLTDGSRSSTRRMLILK